MANIHILEQNVNEKTVRAAFHYAVPATNNAVGLPWATVILKSQDGVNVSQVPDHATEFPDEAASMASGNVIEFMEIVRFSRLGLTNAEKLAEIQAAYTARQTGLFAKLSSRLDYYGYTV